ncbi:MAG: GreA/GreB family elongation factor [Flavobacteriales bacterium]|nr:GreA/GreB family elongation factor [Flavobacteriales bacterium]
MSRGFVKEDDQEEPPFVPPRASLPSGVDNYVTSEGLAQLKLEREELIKSRKETRTLSERDRRRENTVIDVKISQLDERIDSAQLIAPHENPTEVRFGVQVSFESLSPKGPPRKFKVVGVDEANIRALKVAFTAPIVQAMMGKRVGETFVFEQAGKPMQFEVIQIE